MRKVGVGADRKADMAELRGVRHKSVVRRKEGENYKRFARVGTTAEIVPLLIASLGHLHPCYQNI